MNSDPAGIEVCLLERQNPISKRRFLINQCVMDLFRVLYTGLGSRYTPGKVYIAR